MGRRYVERIQKHFDVRDEGFSIDADNQSFPPSISGIQNGIIVCAMNQREWKAGDTKAYLTAASNVTMTSSNKTISEWRNRLLAMAAGHLDRKGRAPYPDG